MGKKTLVPITPEVLRWAVAESGLTSGEVSKAAGVEPEDLEDWLQGTESPSITEARKMAAALHRQLAVFLLPKVPQTTVPAIEFRHPIGQASRALSPVERRFLRRARRLQEAQAWLVRELERDTPRLPALSTEHEPEAAARTLRSQLGVEPSVQFRWKTPSVAFDGWRSALEPLGVTVLQFAMGEKSCRGFSLWDDAVPLIAVNTFWRDEARIYTLFHELGHLVTRTNSACTEATTTPDRRDPVERWCEEFAAAVLMPGESLSGLPAATDIRTLATLAAQYRVSLRAMAIRLIGLSRATWTLYRDIPVASDRKTGGGGGTGRNRREIREDEVGPRVTEIFVSAVQRDIISESQALDYLDIPAVEFERLRDAV